MPITDELRHLIYDARDEKPPLVCLLGTIGRDGPNISPKSSVVVLDDGHLAFWERARQKAA